MTIPTPDALAELLALATPLPWAWDGVEALVWDAGGPASDYGLIAELERRDGFQEAEHNTALIVAAVNALPEHLATIARLEEENGALREALEKLRDCDWTITLPDRMDAVRDIARQALAAREG